MSVSPPIEIAFLNESSKLFDIKNTYIDCGTVTLLVPLNIFFLCNSSRLYSKLYPYFSVT